MAEKNVEEKEREEDPFFSEENMERLRRAAEQMERTGGTVHEVIFEA